MLLVVGPFQTGRASISNAISVDEVNTGQFVQSGHVKRCHRRMRRGHSAVEAHLRIRIHVTQEAQRAARNK
jgi:hypothetical protein